MFTSFTGYAGDNFHVVSNSKVAIWQENLTNLAATLKIVGTRWVHGARFFQLQGPLALGGVRLPTSTKGSGLLKES